VRTLVASEKFHYLASRARELRSYVKSGNLPVVEFLAGDLSSEMSSAINRWEFLDPQTREGLKKVIVLIEQVLQSVRRESQPDSRIRAKLLKKCDVILAILSGESGKIQSDVEGRGAK